MPKRYYITTPIYYVNGLPHIGTATTTLIADATTRYRRLRGEDAFFLTGTDEHAQKVADAAAQAGKSPQEFVDSVSQRFVETWNYLACDYDVFMRTSDPRHKGVVQEVFRRLEASGAVYLGTYEGWYSVSDETFYRDSEVDENGTVKETGAKVERIREDNHYFRLSAFGDRLKAHIAAQPDFLQPETRKNEVLAFIEQGLRDVPISRRANGWGIPVPGDDTKQIYVWFDALINYLTESGWPTNPDWADLWPADVHLMGKEIYTRFHATLWPAMLMALELPLPKHVVGHGWWLIGGEKGSKSKGNIPLPKDVVADLVARSGAAETVAIDALRYYLLREIQFSSDSEYSFDALVSRYNADLANDLGNVLNRVLSAPYFDGVIPAVAEDATLSALARDTVAAYEAALERFDWGTALASAWNLVRGINLFLADRAPWKRAKEGDTAAVADAVYNALEAGRIATVLITPAMPHVAAEINLQMGVAEVGVFSEATRWGGLVPGARIATPSPIFPRIENKPQPKETKKETVNVAPETPLNNHLSIQDFLKVELRVADILSAERIEGAKKLLRLQIRVGEGDERQLVAGIAESYAPEDLPGRQIVVVANLQPAVIRGVESQGMLLAATDAEGRAILLAPDKAVHSGAKVK